MKTTSAEKIERRAKKELKRQKQRIASVERAKKMHVARLENIKTKCRPGKTFVSKLQIGCSGWFYWDWRGKFYPDTLKTSQWFSHYAAHFKTVELNAPFYSWPTIATVKSWLRQAGKLPFVYTVKVSELITHIKKFQGTKNLIKDFSYIADILGPSMGCFLFQLPPSYTFTSARLKNILQQLNPRHRNVVEFRHKSWWNKKVFKAFEKAGIIFCSCSGPKLPDELVKTADDIYVRFHGTEKWYRHDYSVSELAVWAERIKKSRAKRIWIYFNNDYGGNAIKNAQQLNKMLGE